MMQTILFTIFAVTLSSSNRLLLQSQPLYVPIVAQQPANPGVGVGVGGGGQQPSGPAEPAGPGVGVGVGGTPATGTPATGTPATGTPGGKGIGGGVGGGAVTPAGPPVWTPPTIPSLTQIQQQTVMECTLPNTAQAGCAGRTQRVTNAARNYAAKCSNIGACASSVMEFNYQNSYVERVELIDFSEMYAGYKATVVIDSTESLAMKQYIDVLKCGAYGACMDCNIYLVGGSSMNDLQCSRPEYCQNCVIHEDCTRNPIPGALPKYICVQNKPCFNY